MTTYVPPTIPLFELPTTPCVDEDSFPSSPCNDDEDTFLTASEPSIEDYKLCLRLISTQLYCILRVGRKLFTNQPYKQEPKISAR